MQVLKTLLIVFLIIFSISFVLKNDWIVKQKYEIEYYGYQSPPIPLVLLFLGNILLGALLMVIPTFLKNQRLRKIVKNERKKIAQMEKELRSLRNLPITEEKNIEQVSQKT